MYARKYESRSYFGSSKRKKRLQIGVKKLHKELSLRALSAPQASGIKVANISLKHHEPRGYFCGIGRCTNCVMTVNGNPNVRTCVTPVEAGSVLRQVFWKVFFKNTDE